MSWLDKMERRFGRYAIPHLMNYVIILYAFGFVLYLINPSFYYNYLCLDAGAILHGQIWRIVTFIVEPPSTSIIWIIFALLLYYMIGQNLEAAWGAFKFNVYFFSGMILHVIAALLVYLIFRMTLPLGTTYLNLSLFLVFAALFPDTQFRLYFIIPIKAKWLGILDAAFFAWAVIQAFLPSYGGNPYYGYYYQANALAAVVSVLNFLIFFVTMNWSRISPRQRRRRKNFRQATQSPPVMHYKNGAKHQCTICGRTELDDPNLEFRYCSKCKGNHEYCQDHLFTHTHIQ